MPQVGDTRPLKDGGLAVFDGNTWRRPASRNVTSGSTDPTDTKGVQASAEQRGRINITFDPALEAHRSIVEKERTKGNVFNREWGARIAEAVPFDSGSIARTIGGQDYQDYESASRAFESAMLPILSGAAVTESEARRMIRAAQPQLGDSPQTLAQKARRREQMLNGAALGVGSQAPFPNSRAYRGPARPGATGPLAGVSPLRRKGTPEPNAAQQNPRQTKAPITVRTPQDAARLPVGTVYQTPDGQVYRR